MLSPSASICGVANGTACGTGPASPGGFVFVVSRDAAPGFCWRASLSEQAISIAKAVTASEGPCFIRDLTRTFCPSHPCPSGAERLLPAPSPYSPRSGGAAPPPARPPPTTGPDKKSRQSFSHARRPANAPGETFTGAVGALAHLRQRLRVLEDV